MLASLAAVALPCATLAQTAGGDPGILTPERVYAEPALAGPVARGVSLSPDGDLVAFVRSRDDVGYVVERGGAPGAGGGR
ncbi:MAG: hypothetical protein ACK5QD_08505, partial [Brevundimonas sp.]|uniref:hypothetical protein n=1 Tax=Brevundimonas sp. TaxID=1871086 RepID=UPI00391ABD0C